MISVSGIRGVIGDGLTPDIVSRYASAFGSFAGGGKIIVGRDARNTGPMLEHAVFAGLMASGCDVINLGLSATPTIQLAVENYNAAGGIAITASHNPQEWNAVKFMNRNGIFLDADEGVQVLEMAENLKTGYVSYKNVGSVEHHDSFDSEHINAILNSKSIKPEIIRKKKFRVVVDAINGAGSFILPSMLQALGCDVIKIYCDGNGEFTRGAEPLPENLKHLCEQVIETGAAVGFACDP
ncbi:phosphoglucosamine mutase, partial [candidate division KSB1 bacterium]